MVLGLAHTFTSAEASGGDGWIEAGLALATLAVAGAAVARGDAEVHPRRWKASGNATSEAVRAMKRGMETSCVSCSSLAIEKQRVVESFAFRRGRPARKVPPIRIFSRGVGISSGRRLIR
jgi:hypothetical protein